MNIYINLMDNYNLNTKWYLWFHSLTNTSWNKQSYKKLFELSNLYDLKILNDILLKNHLQNGIFFIMRENIFPTWEDPENRNGSCISYKIPGDELYENWSLIINRVLTEDILINKDKFNEINGLSISPKKEFNILKIWLRDNYQNKTVEHLIQSYQPHFIENKAKIRKHDI